jgi:hypothetical protein
VRSGARRLLVVASGLAAVAPAAAHAASTPTTLARVGSDAPVAAYGGYVAWSEKGADHRWRLVVWHDGTRRTQRQIASRGKPFDVDLGPDAAGRPTLVFSRCGRLCRLKSVALPGGAEQPLPVPIRSDASDRTPTLWRDRVVFQRLAPRQRVSRIISYTFSRGRLRILRHGTVPRYHGHAKGRAEAMDLDAGHLAFVWEFSPPQIGVDDEEEMRVERLADRRLILGDVGYTDGACGFTAPVSPNAKADGALYVSYYIGLDQVCADMRLHGAAYHFAFGATKPLRVHGLDHKLVRNIARDAATGVVYATIGRVPHMTLVRV